MTKLLSSRTLHYMGIKSIDAFSALKKMVWNEKKKRWVLDKGDWPKDEEKPRFEQDDVTSTHLSKVRYDNRSKMLTVWFSDSSIYEYANVPRNIYDNLLAAPSKGKYFNKNIRLSYKYSKVKQGW